MTRLQIPANSQGNGAEPGEGGSAVNDPFDLERLRLRQDFADMLGVKKALVINPFGVDSIKRIRKARRMTLRELADRTGLLGPALARADRAGTDPRASTVAAIAKGLGVAVCELFEESGHEQPGRKAKGKR